MKEYNKYIGDGVYVSYDGYHVVLAVNDHRNPVVYLAPDVVESLKECFKEIEGLKVEILKEQQSSKEGFNSMCHEAQTE